MKRMIMVMTAAGGIMLAAPSYADVFTWVGGSGDWHDAAKWDQAAVPGNGDVVVVPSGAVSLTNATAELAAFTINGGTFTFSNWVTRLSATNVQVLGSSKLTLPTAFSDEEMSNRVWVVCHDFTLGAGASVDVAARGYLRGGKALKGSGPGAISGSNNPGPGASHGGLGGGAAQAPVYGAAAAPLAPGSGGAGSSWALGGNGGGAVRIAAAGAVVVDGTISANAGNGSIRSGAGSGGSVYITCATINGGGLISAAGGESDYGDNGSAGGGGRIAVVYDTAAQALLPVPALRFWAQGGTIIRQAEPGTIYFPDSRMFAAAVVQHRGTVVTPDGPLAWERDSLVISNGWLRFTHDGFRLVVTNGLTLVGNNTMATLKKDYYRSAGRLDLFAAELAVGGDVTITNGASLYAYPGQEVSSLAIGGDLSLNVNSIFTHQASPTNGVTDANTGGLLTVGGKLELTGNSWLYPVCDWTNGASIFMEAGALVVGAAAGIDANARGYGNDKSVNYSTNNYGPGKGGYSYGGGGYGGRGGGIGGAVYGSVAHPDQPGSAGADEAAHGGNGGGLVHLTVAGGVTINGAITANGEDGLLNNTNRRSGSGSGGGIYIACAWLAGSGGMVTADGGRASNSASSTQSGGGGGGRIAVIYDTVAQDALPLPDVSFSAKGGRGTYIPMFNRDDMDGDLGTLYFSDSRLLTNPVRHSGVWLAPGFTDDWVVQNLVVEGHWIRLPQSGQRVEATESVFIAGDGRLDLCNGELVSAATVVITNRGTLTLFGDAPGGPTPSLTVAGDLRLYDRSFVNIYGRPTNGVEECGALVEVSGALALGTNCWVWPFSDVTNSGSPRFYVGALDMSNPVSGFNAAARGCAGGPAASGSVGFGLGGGKSLGGGGYGGDGGVYNVTSGKAYGSLTHPSDPGSGGGGTTSGTSPGGHGGGLIWIHSKGRARIGGTLNAEGGNAPGSTNGYGGGGSGGGIYLRCTGLYGDGSLTVKGGNGGGHSSSGGGSGAGGRIALWRMVDHSSFTSNIVAGTAVKETRVGQEGTYYVGTLPMPGTTLLLR